MYIYPFPYSLKFIAFLYSVPRGFLWIFGSTIGILGATKNLQLASWHPRSYAAWEDSPSSCRNMAICRNLEEHHPMSGSFWYRESSGSLDLQISLGKQHCQERMFFSRGLDLNNANQSALSLIHSTRIRAIRALESPPLIYISAISEQLVSNIQAWKKPHYWYLKPRIFTGPPWMPWTMETVFHRGTGRRPWRHQIEVPWPKSVEL